MIDHDKKQINVWWPTQPKPGNFGDIITPFIIKKMSGYTATYSGHPFTKPTLLSTGSIINKATANTTVWGSGAMNAADAPSSDATYLAVRGPITRDLILKRGGKCPANYGDPALLLPHLYKFEKDEKYDIGIVPHYVDYNDIVTKYKNNKNIKVINLLNADPTLPLKEMLQCRNLISSSLHGIIAAAAYGIPVSWVKFSDKLYGDGTKFMDFFQSIKVKHTVTELTSIETEDSLIGIPKIKKDSISVTRLIKSFPIKG